MNRRYFLDSSAVLALIHNEPGGDLVADVLSDAAISAVNLTEVITCLVRDDESPSTVLRLITLLELPVVPWDETAARESAKLAHLADRGLSLGDRACLTETMRHSGTQAMTADRAWKTIPEIADRVVLIR